MQHLAQFYTTSDFDRKYLPNETRYPKSERYVIENNDSSCVQPSKSGELWSTNYKVGHVSLCPPKSGDYISALGGAGPSDFYPRDLRLLAHTPNGDRDPPKI